jgi:hypothetical protein
VQCEYNRVELSDDVFHKLYYGDDRDSEVSAHDDQTSRHELVQNIDAVKRILTQHYPDCAPLRAILKSADLAIKSLESWTARA